MQTIVYQGLQSCFESQVIETTTLKLKVGAPMELNRGVTMVGYQEINHKKSMPSSTNLDMGGWTFLQSLPNISSSTKDENEKCNNYIHPLAKSSPRLSQKSLELCTENLGSETGSEENMEISILSLNSPNPRAEISSSMELFDFEKPKQTNRQTESRNKIAPRNFPPPLTTIRSSNSLQVRHHRENGRLIIEAIETPSRNTYLQAERSNGRLRLSFFNECAAECNHDDSEMINEENDIDYENQDDDNYEECYEEQDDYFLRENDAEIDGDFERNGMAKFQRPSRCNESGHGNNKGGLCNFKPLWVTTS